MQCDKHLHRIVEAIAHEAFVFICLDSCYYKLSLGQIAEWQLYVFLSLGYPRVLQKR